MNYLPLWVISMAAGVWGMSIQNNTSVASNRKLHSYDIHPKVHSRSKRMVDPVSVSVGLSVASGALSGGLAGGAAGGLTAGQIAGLSTTLAAAGIGAASAIGTSSMHLAYSRSFEMRVENLLKVPLLDARYLTWWGDISSPPHDIRPCEVGGLAGHKHPGTATGTHGIVSWKIKEKGVTIILFWSVPYDYSWCNSLGLAIYTDLEESEPSFDNRYKYFDDIYWYSENFPTSGEREPKTIKTFYHCNHAMKICTSNAGLIVCGIMSTNSNANFDVQVAEVGDLLYCAGDKMDVRKPSGRLG